MFNITLDALENVAKSIHQWCDEQETARANVLDPTYDQQIPTEELDQAFPPEPVDHTDDMYFAWLENRIQELEKRLVKLDLELQMRETF
jgi:hypothetical protein